jgi:hypothetical protein
VRSSDEPAGAAYEGCWTAVGIGWAHPGEAMFAEAPTPGCRPCSAARPTQRGETAMTAATDANPPQAGRPGLEHDRLAMSVEEVSRALEISTWLGYELIARGELPSIRLGQQDHGSPSGSRADAYLRWSTGAVNGTPTSQSDTDHL